jgi:hypothetical protein
MMTDTLSAVTLPAFFDESYTSSTGVKIEPFNDLQTPRA